MQRFLLGNLILTAAVFLAGCAPAEIKPPADAIPTILPGRSAPTNTPDAAAGQGKTGRTPSAPR